MSSSSHHNNNSNNNNSRPKTDLERYFLNDLGVNPEPLDDLLSGESGSHSGNSDYDERRDGEGRGFGGGGIKGGTGGTGTGAGAGGAAGARAGGNGTAYDHSFSRKEKTSSNHRELPRETSRSPYRIEQASGYIVHQPKIHRYRNPTPLRQGNIELPSSFSAGSSRRNFNSTESQSQSQSRSQSSSQLDSRRRRSHDVSIVSRELDTPISSTTGNNQQSRSRNIGQPPNVRGLEPDNTASNPDPAGDQSQSRDAQQSPPQSRLNNPPLTSSSSYRDITYTSTKPPSPSPSSQLQRQYLERQNLSRYPRSHSIETRADHTREPPPLSSSQLSPSSNVIPPSRTIPPSIPLSAPLGTGTGFAVLPNPDLAYVRTLPRVPGWSERDERPGQSDQTFSNTRSRAGSIPLGRTGTVVEPEEDLRISPVIAQVAGNERWNRNDGIISPRNRQEGVTSLVGKPAPSKRSSHHARSPSSASRQIATSSTSSFQLDPSLVPRTTDIPPSYVRERSPSISIQNTSDIRATSVTASVYPLSPRVSAPSRLYVPTDEMDMYHVSAGQGPTLQGGQQRTYPARWRMTFEEEQAYQMGYEAGVRDEKQRNVARAIEFASESRHAPPPQHSWPGGDVQDMGPGPHRDSRWMSSAFGSERMPSPILGPSASNSGSRYSIRPDWSKEAMATTTGLREAKPSSILGYRESSVMAGGSRVPEPRISSSGYKRSYDDAINPSSEYTGRTPNQRLRRMSSSSWNEGTHNESGPSSSSRRIDRQAISCDMCRQRKSKCDGEPPHPCGACSKRGTEGKCRYVEQVRRRGPGKKKDPEEKGDISEVRTDTDGGGQQSLKDGEAGTRHSSNDGSYVDEMSPRQTSPGEEA